MLVRLLPLNIGKIYLVGHVGASGKSRVSLYSRTPHSFRSGGAVSPELAGDSTPTVIQRAFWKRPRTVHTYMRSMEVVSPGSKGDETLWSRAFQRISVERSTNSRRASRVGHGQPSGTARCCEQNGTRLPMIRNTVIMQIQARVSMGETRETLVPQRRA